MEFLWFWSFWHWSAEGALGGALLRGPLHGVAGHWEEWFQYQALPHEREAIEQLSRSTARQREFISWLARHWAPVAMPGDLRPPTRFLLGQLSTLAPFDTWASLAGVRESYGVPGIAAIVLSEGSAGEAGDIRRNEALAIPQDRRARAPLILAEGFTAPVTQLETARSAVENLVCGRGLLVLLCAWLLCGVRPFPASVRRMLLLGWAVLAVALSALLFGPDMSAQLEPVVAMVTGLWIALTTVALVTCTVVGVQAWRSGQRLRDAMWRVEFRLRMPGGLRLVGGSAGLPFALNILLATQRAVPDAVGGAWFWRRIFRVLRTDAAQWAATGGIDEAGRVLPVILEPKLRASLQHAAVSRVLIPHQSGASAQIRAAHEVRPAPVAPPQPAREPGVPLGFAADERRTPALHRCRSLAGATMAVALLASRGQLAATILALVSSAVMLAAVGDLRAILAPPPAPMVLAPLTTTAYVLSLSLDTARPQDFWIVLESGFWANRRTTVPDDARSGAGLPDAELRLTRATHQSTRVVDDGTISLERRRRVLFREFDPGERVGRFSLSYLLGRHE